MLTKVHIDVTQEDIDGGCAGNSLECPVARAFRRVTGKDVTVHVSYAAYDYQEDGAHKVILLPTDVASFIWEFDNGDSVSPFSFDVWMDV